MANMGTVEQDILRICPELGERVTIRNTIAKCGLFSHDCASEILKLVPDLRQRRVRPPFDRSNMFDDAEIVAFQYSFGWLAYKVGRSDLHYYFDNNGKYAGSGLGIHLEGAYQVSRDVIAINQVGRYRILRLKILPSCLLYTKFDVPKGISCSVVLPCGVAIYRVGNKYIMQ